jgi:hypothetical protein
MTAITRAPQNTNYLQPTKFLLVFNRSPATQYFCQSVNLPGVSVDPITRSTPTLETSYPSNKINYEDLQITFTIDEAMESWKQMYEWFRTMAYHDQKIKKDLMEQYGGKLVSDGILTVLSSLNNPLFRIQFADMYPVSLSDVQFDTKTSADDILTASVTFKYTHFDILPLNA